MLVSFSFFFSSNRMSVFPNQINDSKRQGDPFSLHISCFYTYSLCACEMCEEIIIIAGRLMLKSAIVCLVIDMSYHKRTVFTYTQLKIILYMCVCVCFIVNLIAC
jgi:hypothetical protein